ncbi:MAG: hypothetical protein ABJG68_05075 [Crocinitomicaceae bacterium]
MIKTTVLVLITLLVIYLGLELSSILFEIPRSEILSWTGIIFLAYWLEKGLKYILLLPFKIYLGDVRKHPMGKSVQEMGFTLSYISVWLAVGFTPINAIVQGNTSEHLITYPLFLKIALVLIIATILFSILWWISLKLKK